MDETETCGVLLRPGGLVCDQPFGHDEAHANSHHHLISWTYTMCWEEHDPGLRCTLEIGHDRALSSNQWRRRIVASDELDDVVVEMLRHIADGITVPKDAVLALVHKLESS